MAVVQLKTKIDQLIDVDAAVQIAKETLLRQRQDLFSTKGVSDGGDSWPDHRGDSSRQVLTDSGKLRDLVEFDVETRPFGFRITMFSAPGLELISNVHQFGTKLGKDIVPKTAKALFIPTSGRGKKSFLNISLGKSEAGSNFISIPKHVEGQPAFGKRKRFGIKGSRSGKASQVVDLKLPRTIKSGKRKGEQTKGDFVLVSRIPATPEKDNRAIQQRQHFRVTKQSAKELVNNIMVNQSRS